jgi:hypothetical protein
MSGAGSSGPTTPTASHVAAAALLGTNSTPSRGRTSTCSACTSGMATSSRARRRSIASASQWTPHIHGSSASAQGLSRRSSPGPDLGCRRRGTPAVFRSSSTQSAGRASSRSMGVGEARAPNRPHLMAAHPRQSKPRGLPARPHSLGWVPIHQPHPTRPEGLPLSALQLLQRVRRYSQALLGRLRSAWHRVARHECAEHLGG